MPDPVLPASGPAKPKLKPDPKLIGVVAAVLAIGYFGYEHVKLQSNLRSTTRITQSLRDEIEGLRKQNESFKQRDAAEQTQLQSLSHQLNSLQQDKSLSTGKQVELQKLVASAEQTLASQNQKIGDLESKLRDAEKKISRQKRASVNLEKQTRSAKANPGMTPEYLKIVENEWMMAVARTEELQQDLDKTLVELAGQNQERSKLVHDTATMHYNLAVILTDQQNFPAALVEYQKVLEIRPNDPDAHYNMAVLYDDYLRNNEKALEHYRQYVRIAPESPESQKVRQWIKDKEFDTTMKFKL